MVGDLNANLDDPEVNYQDEKISSALATAVLKDIPGHFLSHDKKWARDGRMWIMICMGREVRSQTDYLLGTDQHLFCSISFQDPQHNSDRYMIPGFLCSTTLK